MLAVVLHIYDWDWEGAELEYRRALELNPGDASPRGFYAMLLAQCGQGDASIEEARRAVRADPLSGNLRGTLGTMLFLARRLDAAVDEARAGIELDPTNHILHMVFGWAFAARGRNQEAIEAFKQATSLASDAGAKLKDPLQDSCSTTRGFDAATRPSDMILTV